MTKLDQLKHAIHEANLFRSKLSPEALAVPGMTSLKIRHLMNNLGAISRNYYEVGSHKGGSLCSTMFNNKDLLFATGCDNYSEFNEGNPLQELLMNVGKFKPYSCKFKMITKDCWTVDDLPKGIDLYLYDGDHSYEAQRKAITHFLPYMADEFILCVDDFGLEQVMTGTLDGMNDLLQAGEWRLIWNQRFESTPEIPNESWHQGFYVALIRKS